MRAVEGRGESFMDWMCVDLLEEHSLPSRRVCARWEEGILFSTRVCERREEGTPLYQGVCRGGRRALACLRDRLY